MNAPLVRLDEVADIPRGPISPQRFPSELFALFSIPAYSSKSPEVVPGSEIKSGKTLVEAGDVLISKLNPRIPRVWLVDYEGECRSICSTEFIPFRVRDSSVLDSEFLAFMMLAPQFIDELQRMVRSSTGSHERVRPDDICGRRIPQLCIEEQRRIVIRIKKCLRCVEEIEANESLIEPEFAALFPSILNQRFEELLSSAQIRTLEYAAEIRGGQSLPKGTPNDQGEQSVLLVKVGDMNAEGNERNISTSREYFPSSEAPRGLMPAGAVIFPKRGGAIATNKKRLLGRPSLLDPNLMAVVAKPQATRESYLYYWCKTLDLNDLSNGGVIPQLNRKDLAQLEIPLPDLEAQDRIAADLQVSESVCAEMHKQFSEASQERKLLRESILRKAFAGEL